MSVGGVVYSPMISIVQQTHAALSDNGRKNIPKCGYTSLALLLTVLVHTSLLQVLWLSPSLLWICGNERYSLSKESLNDRMLSDKQIN